MSNSIEYNKTNFKPLLFIIILVISVIVISMAVDSMGSISSSTRFTRFNSLFPSHYPCDDVTVICWETDDEDEILIFEELENGDFELKLTRWIEGEWKPVSTLGKGNYADLFDIAVSRGYSP